MSQEVLSEVIFSEAQVQERVKQLAEELNKDYNGKDLVVICVLKGAFMFFSDLVKHLTVRPRLDFVRIASYGNKTSSEERVYFTKDVELPLKEQHVLIVEDVVDTGRSMEFLYGQLNARGAKSIKLCALVDKFERRAVDIKVDYAGFHLEEGFIVGCGLDYAEKYRELPEIRILELK